MKEEMDISTQIAAWLNNHTGVLAVIIFFATLFLGWITGIFSSLRRKPKFKASLLDGPTFSCTYVTGKTKNEHDVHRTGIALYLSVANIGSSAASLRNVSVAYHWNIKPVSLLWFKYSLGWFWLHDQTAALTDFQGKIGEYTKVYPFLTQDTTLIPHKTVTYLNIGQSTNGVVYFEQQDSWGGCSPKGKKDIIKIKVMLHDSFGKKHTYKLKIPVVSMDYARKYNPSFGKTLAELNGESLPHDQ